MKYDYEFVRQMDSEEFAEWVLTRLCHAYKMARRGKRRTRDEQLFEMNDAENLLNLRDAALLHLYEPQPGIAFTVERPVWREIFAAPFTDRVIHHFLFEIVYDWWDNRLINDAYSCRRDKGVLYGVKRLDHHIRSVSNSYQKRAYVIKLDIKGYFMSLSRKRLMERVDWGLERQFPHGGQLYEMVRYLWQQVIFDDPTDGVVLKGDLSNWDNLPADKSLFCQPPGYGIVIGNLTSQLLSNLYLDLLDRFIVYELGYKHYGRYVDDFFIVVPEEEYAQAKKDIKRIKEFLWSIELKLHPNKVYMQEVRKGVTWLGATVKPYGILPARRIKGYFYEAMEKYGMDETSAESIMSYIGHMAHYKSKKFENKVFEAFGGEYRW